MADRLMRDLSATLSPALTEPLGCRAEKRSAFRRMNPIRRITLRSSALLAVFCLLSSVFCCAEELPDPTKLPASLVVPAIAPVSGVAASQPTGLQSIIISKTRRAAIIDGETVELGEKHGDAKLAEVNEGSVVLTGAQGRQVLTLFPDVKLVSNKEVKTKPRPAATKVQAGKQKIKPVAHDEKLLSGHPEEKK